MSLGLRSLTVLVGRALDKDCHFLCPWPQVSECGHEAVRPPRRVEVSDHSVLWGFFISQTSLPGLLPGYGQ